MTPRAGPIFTPDYNLNNFGNGPLSEATYQISKTWAFWFQTRRFLKVLLFFIYLLPWQPEFFLDTKFLNNFQIVPPKAHSSEVLSNLAQWLGGDVSC